MGLHCIIEYTCILKELVFSSVDIILNVRCEELLRDGRVDEAGGGSGERLSELRPEQLLAHLTAARRPLDVRLTRHLQAQARRLVHLSAAERCPIECFRDVVALFCKA